MSRPKRLPNVSYIGLQRYSLTFCVKSRRKVFLDHTVARVVLDQIVRVASDERMAILAYCVMPDHVHLLVESIDPSGDLRRFAKMAKQRSGARYASRQHTPLWQEGYYEHLLREDEPVKRVARYIISNPVRAGLVDQPSEYPLSGSTRWTMAEICDGIADS